MVSKDLKEVQPKVEKKTYPTSYREDQQEDPGLRIDGVFVNEKLGELYEAECEVVDTSVCETLSDHYPCLVNLKVK